MSIQSPLQGGKRNIFQRGQSHFSWFFPSVKCFFPVENSHFGTPKTNFSGLKSEKGEKKGSFLIFKLGGFRLTYFFLAISFFLLLLLTICFFFHMLYPISTKLGQNDHWVSRYKSYQQFDLKGHVRVTEVKKVILKENATPSTWFIGFWRNLVRITSRQVATKVINSLTLKVM